MYEIQITNWGNGLVEKSSIQKSDEDDKYGYVYEVDLEYPDSIKKRTFYYPLCPEKMIPKIPEDEKTDYEKSFTPENYYPREKLMMTHGDKKNYIVEGRTLDFYLEQGMILKKIHRKLKYKKSDWLKPFIDFNVKKRMEYPKNTFGNFFFKLLNNAFYGKTLENVRKYCNY